jgi:hypothetical protein
MRVKIITAQTAEQELFALAEILYKLRYHSAKWHEQFGAANRANKKYWEDKADQWINQHVKEE